VITQDMNKPFFEKVWARPRTIAPDLLSKSPMPLMFETVDDKKVLTDGTRTLEIYRLKESRHNVAISCLLPKERLLYYGDGYNPPPGADREIRRARPNMASISTATSSCAISMSPGSRRRTPPAPCLMTI